jgi:hypothetical protein
MKQALTDQIGRRGFARLGLVWLLAWCAAGLYLLNSGASAGPTSSVASIRPTVASTDAPRYRSRSIESLGVGDIVLARDQNNPAAPVLPKRILDVFSRTADHLQLIRVSDGLAEQELKTTNTHPFWVIGGGWVKARDLKSGQKVTGPDGQPLVVVSSVYEPHPEGVTVYNFKVEDSHTYFVSAENSTGPPVWVHNANCPNNIVYRLIDETGATMYYGKTQTTRFQSTLRRHSYGENAKSFSGLQVLAEGLTPEEALSLERHLIEQGRAAGEPLVNKLSGAIHAPLPFEDVAPKLKVPTQSYFPLTPR